jgi:hypothetical protein
MGFNLNDYETVEVRLAKFIADYPDFRIDTQLLEASDKRFIVRTAIYRTYLDAVPFATGLAFELVSDKGVNATSALENAETSSLGRSLAQAGYATKGKRPSQEEMAKVVKGNQVQPKPMYGSPGSKSAAMEMAIRQSIAESPWVAPEAEEDPVQWEVNDVATALGAEVVDVTFECAHGKMIRREGTSSKTGKPYYGFVCTEKSKANQCEAKWASLTANGKWSWPRDDK